MEAFERLEVEFARWNGLDPAGMVACSSGTSALHLAFEALRLPLGSEAIVPDMTMVACARAVTLAGLTPVFVDCGDDLLIDQNLARNDGFVCRNREPVTRALMLVHVYGRRCPFVGIGWPVLRDSVYLIEDLAEAHGVKPYQETDAACWSFYRNKIVAGEEGGAVWFRDPDHATLARQLRNLGFTEAHNFFHIPRGHNYRMSNAHAHQILGSLRNVDENLRQRRRIEAWYDGACPADWRMPPRNVPWIFDIKLPETVTKQIQDSTVAELNKEGIQARHFFKPMSEQEEFRHCKVVGNGNAKRWSVRGIYLPTQPGVTTETMCCRSFEIIKARLRESKIAF